MAKTTSVWFDKKAYDLRLSNIERCKSLLNKNTPLKTLCMWFGIGYIEGF